MYYFDNAATTFPKPEPVYRFMDEFYRKYGVNVGRGQFKEASIANKMVEDTRDSLLKLFHCSKGTRQVVFTASATEAINLVLKGMHWSKGDVIYTTPFEHNAVLRTLYYLESHVGIEVNFIEPDKKTFQYDFDKIENEFSTKKPKAVIVNHASNVIGAIAPISKLFKLAKLHNAITIADMSQTAGLIDTNLLDIQCDYAVFAGHKTLYGPFGIGGVIAPLKCALEPLIIGGTGVESANPNMPDIEPIRYEAGSPSLLAIAGLNASIKWINEIGINNIYEKENKTTSELIKLLGNYSNITIYGSKDLDRVGVISCNFDGYSSDSIGQVLSNNDIAYRSGLHCAPKAHEFLGTFPAGTVRLSVSYFTSTNEINKLKEILDYIEENA